MLLEKYEDSVAINIGSGQEISIGNLASLVSKIVGFEGDIRFNTNRPNGTQRKLLNSTRISELGWKPQVSLEDGITATYDWYLEYQTKESTS
jgi:GDP-L-fucose synthase